MPYQRQGKGSSWRSYPRAVGLERLPAICRVAHKACNALPIVVFSENNRSTNSSQLCRLFVGRWVGHGSPVIQGFPCPVASRLALFGELRVEKLLATLPAGLHRVFGSSHTRGDLDSDDMRHDC